MRARQQRSRDNREFPQFPLPARVLQRFVFHNDLFLAKLKYNNDYPLMWLLVSISKIPSYKNNLLVHVRHDNRVWS